MTSPVWVVVCADQLKRWSSRVAAALLSGAIGRPGQQVRREPGRLCDAVVSRSAGPPEVRDLEMIRVAPWRCNGAASPAFIGGSIVDDDQPGGRYVSPRRLMALTVAVRHEQDTAETLGGATAASIPYDSWIVEGLRRLAFAQSTLSHQSRSGGATGHRALTMDVG